MLKTFRENFKHLQWILWLVIAIFVIFVFVDWGMGSARGVDSNDVVARAGGTQISMAEFQREYKETEDRYRSMYGKNFSPELLKMLNLPEQVLNGLIDRRIMNEEARRLHIGVSDEELSRRILGEKDSRGNLVFIKDGAFVGDQAYRRMLAGAGYTPDSYESTLRSQMLLEKLNRFLTESVFVGDDEVEADYVSRNVKAKIAYVLRPFSGAAPAVTDAEAEAYFKQNSAAYMQPEKRKGKYLLVDTAKLRESVKIEDADVAKEFNAHIDEYRKPESVHSRHILYKTDGTPAGDAAAKAKAEAALAKLKKGADFAALASAESDDPGSKSRGGDLGSVGRGQGFVKEFEDAAFGAEPNALVGPVKTSFGYHVIQVLDKTPESFQTLPDVAGAIRSRLAEQRASEDAKRIARDISDRLAKSGKPSDDDLRKMTTPSITLNETEFLGRNDAASGIGYNPNFTKALFSLEPGEISDPITTTRGEAILKLAEVKAPGPAAFADVKQKVIADLAKKKQEDAAVAALKEAMGPASSLEELSSKLGLKIETPDSFAKNVPIPGLGLAGGVAEAAFSANVGDLKGPLTVPDKGAIVFKLVEKTPFEKAAFETQKPQIKESLKAQKAGRLIQAMIARRRAEMKIVVSKDLLKRFGT